MTISSGGNTTVSEEWNPRMEPPQLSASATQMGKGPCCLYGWYGNSYYDVHAGYIDIVTVECAGLLSAHAVVRPTNAHNLGHRTPGADQERQGAENPRYFHDGELRYVANIHIGDVIG